MDTLKKFLCDWGTPDSNMLLFFLLTSFLLGLLTGWLIWGRKIQAMLNQVSERDATISDINGKLTIKEDELGKANKSLEELMLKNRSLSEEKGQLYADTIAYRDEIEKLKAGGASITMAAAPVFVAPEVTAEIPLEITTDAADDDSLLAILENEPEAEIEVSEVDVVTTTSEAAAETLIEEAISEPEEAILTTEDVIEEPIAEVAASEPEAEMVAAAVRPDDLKIVEGIGPKIEGLLNDAGIMTFAQLSKTSTERLNEILAAAGRRYQIHDPSTWARQAEMAFNNQWEELKIWQDKLKGGKE